MIGTLPSCQSSSKNVTVFDQVTVLLMEYPSVDLLPICGTMSFVTKIAAPEIGKMINVEAERLCIRCLRHIVRRSCGDRAPSRAGRSRRRALLGDLADEAAGIHLDDDACRPLCRFLDTDRARARLRLRARRLGRPRAAAEAARSLSHASTHLPMPAPRSPPSRRAGARLAILSNGSPRMLEAAVEASGIGGLLDAVLSVDAVRVYKPRPEVYALVTDGIRRSSRNEVVFVSSNRWDVMGAAAFGFRAGLGQPRAHARRIYRARAGAGRDRTLHPARAGLLTSPSANLPSMALGPAAGGYMRAAYYEQNGPASAVVRLGEVETPQPGPGEVRVKLATSGVNPSDVKARSGTTRKIAYPRVIPHSDGAGVIDSVGPGVSSSRIGERVWTWNAQWLRAFGTCAQYVCLASDQAVRMPDKTSFEIGACLGIPAMTAYHAVATAGAAPGVTLLVAGGAGAVGHHAVQFAKAAGANVIATISTPEKAAAARAAGADHTIDYRRENVGMRVMEITAKRASTPSLRSTSPPTQSSSPLCCARTARS